jgi:putative Mn2+ efflux pump MntP
MIMRKRNLLPQKKSCSLSRATLTLYIAGMLTVAVPLFYMILQLTAHSSLSVPEVKYFANALEHILAGVALLTLGCYFVERVMRAEGKK